MKEIYRQGHVSIYKHQAGLTGFQYLIVEDHQLILVDTGLPGSHTSILHSIQRLGHQVTDLQTILITHADPDHYGGAHALKEICDAEVCASQKETPYMQIGAMSRILKPQGLEAVYKVLLPLYTIPPVEVDHSFQPEDELNILDGLIVIDSSGHTPGHISFYAPKHGILFSGDSIKIRGKNLSIYKGGTTWDIDAARQSLNRQIKRPIKLICAGHRTRFL